MTSIPLPGDTQPTRVKTFVDKNWRLSYYSEKNWGELYNIKEDPDEIFNLWDSGQHQTIRLELMARMFEVMVDDEPLSPLQVNIG